MTETLNLADAIHDDLVRRVFQGDLPPGSKLPAERALAAEYSTNRNTLREALRRLEHSRLVTVRQGSGVTVADWRREGMLDSLGLLIKHTKDPAERIRTILDLLVGRMAVLEHAVALAAQHRSEAQLAQIKGILADQQRAYDARNKGALMQGDMALVDALVDASNSLTARWIANSFLEVYRQLAAAAKSLWIFQPDFPEYLQALGAALEHREAETAIQLTRRYYARSDESVVFALETFARHQERLAAALTDSQTAETPDIPSTEENRHGHQP